MSMEKTLEVRAFGGLLLKYDGNTIGANVSKGKSKKMWVMFEYILLNRDRQISQEELIEVFWPEMEIQNPANSLKVLVFKLREEVGKLKYLPGKEIILSISGSYKFNTELNCEIDLDVFEKNINLANDSQLDADTELKYILTAIKMYKGNILSESQREPWAASIQTHYAEIYQKIVVRALEILEEMGEYTTIISMCKNALLIQPFTEIYYYHMVRAYTAQENYSAASEIYTQVKNLMEKEYGVVNDESFQVAYKEIMKAKPKKSLTVMELAETLEEHNNYLASFFVEFGEFKQIYRLTARSLKREEVGAFLCVYTLGVQKGIKVTSKAKDTNMRILGEALAFMLRQEDIFTRSSPNQFSAIINGISNEITESIAERIKEYFEKHRKNNEFGVIFTYLPIAPSSYEEKITKK